MKKLVKNFSILPEFIFLNQGQYQLEKKIKTICEDGINSPVVKA